jgi:hypothetical protein
VIDTSGYAPFKGKLLYHAAMSLGITGQWLAGRIRRVISKPGKESLASQRRAGRTKPIYTPSRPGEPPRRDTGTLMKSIVSPPAQLEGKVLKVYVGTGHAYGRYLERGTRIMLARPYLEVTLRRHRMGLVRVFVHEMKRRMSR